MPPIDALIERHGAATVTAALRPLLSDERVARLEAVLEARLAGLTVVLENLHDPHNGAAAIRSVEALGLTSLHVVESEERFRFSDKVTIGCQKWIELRRYPDVAHCAAALEARGFFAYAAVPGAALPLDEVDVTRPCALVFGNEHAGLSGTAVAAWPRQFAIPMPGFTRSFNLSVSVAVAVHSLAARRRAALGAPGDLPPEERAVLRARWYALDIRGAAEIVARHVSKATHETVGDVPQLRPESSESSGFPGE